MIIIFSNKISSEEYSKIYPNKTVSEIIKEVHTIHDRRGAAHKQKQINYKIAMTQSWFEVKVSYERAGEKGLNTKVNEVYLVQGFTFTEIEKRITQELQPQVTGEFNINEMKRVKYGEIVDTEDENTDKWYKCKIVLVTIDEVSAKEKKTSVVILVKAEDCAGAVSGLNKHMEDSVMAYDLASVNESSIVDIFHYEG